ncbi:hypothetical protein LOZ39_000575 [Ophidiomyces ophidiicola]|nr:hypothetical protein LOZ50_000098 [Ophidiomyces ophidiicola]KAI2057211.1 hypothetical protein LOZ44_001549 [Ophidiomyces ophidiicola]KAI2080854.1 hypothetical protein LOZ39_000575 [Ophidiomyces ophidiicola]KAI2144254.1 hypothetical protein LOZ28_001496 [Ophidiomyces ophidiicola]KAI2146295.1 hypothetical protein LOZ29_000050 [Ophidiomyces ophidiicola]
MPALHSNAPINMTPNYFHSIDSRNTNAKFHPYTMSLYQGHTKHPEALHEDRRSSPEYISTVSRYQPPTIPAESLLERKVSKLKTEEIHLSKISTGPVSPLSTLDDQAYPATPKLNIIATTPAPAAIVSPLSAGSSQQFQSFATNISPPPAHGNFQSSPHPDSGFASASLTKEWSEGWTPKVSSFSRSSTERPRQTRFPDGRADGVLDSGRYDLICPVVAGVFDEKSPRLKRNPTFRKQLSINESKMKPLPPAPDISIIPRALRQKFTKSGPLALPHSPERIFLPQKPEASDLYSLDEAFRRSGLLENDSSSFPCSPLHHATMELERQLSQMSSSTPYMNPVLSELSPGYSKLSMGGSSALLKENSHAQSPEILSQHPDPLPTQSWLDLEPTESKSYRGSTLSPQETCASLVNQQNLKHHHSFDTFFDTPRPSHSRSVSLQDSPSFTTEQSRKTLSPKSRTHGDKRPRVRLPRMRSVDLPFGARELANLSVVVESPSEGECPRTEDIKDCVVPTRKEHPGGDLSGFRIESPDFCVPENHTPIIQSPESQVPLFSHLLDVYTASCTPTRTSRDYGQVVNDIPAVAAEEIVLQILRSVDTLEDLFSLAVLNSAFYSIFKKNELPLIKRIMFRVSPSAWELREMSIPWEDDDFDVGPVDRPVPEYTPNLYLRHYMRDLCTMVSLKWLILVRCEHFLRPETVRALAGQDEKRSAELDDAFWRVWTFCRLFGCGKGREEDITTQADWLSGGSHARSNNRGSSAVLTSPLIGDEVPFLLPDGFARGNEGGLTATQLYDMMEIWTCLGVLIQAFHGKNSEARQYGVFDDLDVDPGTMEEDAMLECWTQYLLTLGPSAILTLCNLNPDTPIEDMFSRAQSLGWTQWTSPTKAKSGSNRSFLKEAVSRVHENQLVREEGRTQCITTQAPSGLSLEVPPYSPKQRVRSYSAGTRIPKQRRKEFAIEIRQKRQDNEKPTQRLVPAVEERPTSNFEQVIQQLDGTQHQFLSGHSAFYNYPYPAPERRSAPPLYPQAIITAAPAEAEEKIPVHDHHTSVLHQKYSHIPPPGFIDPADRALHKLVHELGFNESDAKWALKCTDTGESVDVEAAINLLLPNIDTNPAGSYGNVLVHSPPLAPSSRPVSYCLRSDARLMNRLSMGDTEQIQRPPWRWA